MSEFNVMQYGATGDGVTNDATAIANAVAAAGPGDVVYFPAGTYRCAAAPIFLGTGKTLRGARAASVTIVRDLGTAGTALIRVSGTDAVIDRLGAW